MMTEVMLILVGLNKCFVFKKILLLILKQILLASRIRNTWRIVFLIVGFKRLMTLNSTFAEKMLLTLTL